ncbi:MULTISPECIES: ATP-grasp domain-containing protein [unclassified Pseudomonas]|uniref:ATP-grasp domain-containing protein n=1 Tax=unclassified Pseudomonas TaxID=196821 RepID=UPI001CE039E8|nr:MULTISPECIES: ATP-grasp domain-containing protein [unclassified Pseudomonas]
MDIQSTPGRPPTYLVTAIGSFCAEAVIHSLRQAARARVVGISTLPREWTATSALLDAFHRAPPARDVPGYIARVLDICRLEQVTHVLPLIDLEVDALTLHRQEFSTQGVVLCMAPAETVRISRDKWLVYDTFRDHSLIHPIPTWKMEDPEVDGLPFPLHAKPRDGRSSEGLARILDADDLGYLRKKLRTRPYVVQPLLDGDVHVVDIVRRRATGQWAGMARKELVRTSNGAGVTVRMLDEPALLDAAAQVAIALDLDGCINIEFLVGGDWPLVMDVNPRFSGGVAFSHLSGYDMVTNHLRCFSGEALDPPVVPAPAIHARRYVETTFALPDDLDTRTLLAS